MFLWGEGEIYFCASIKKLHNLSTKYFSLKYVTFIVSKCISIFYQNGTDMSKLLNFQINVVLKISAIKIFKFHFHLLVFPIVICWRSTYFVYWLATFFLSHMTKNVTLRNIDFISSKIEKPWVVQSPFCKEPYLWFFYHEINFSVLREMGFSEVQRVSNNFVKVCMFKFRGI